MPHPPSMVEFIPLAIHTFSLEMAVTLGERNVFFLTLSLSSEERPYKAIFHPFHHI